MLSRSKTSDAELQHHRPKLGKRGVCRQVHHHYRLTDRLFSARHCQASGITVTVTIVRSTLNTRSSHHDASCVIITLISRAHTGVGKRITKTRGQRRQTTIIWHVTQTDSDSGRDGPAVSQGAYIQSDRQLTQYGGGGVVATAAVAVAAAASWPCSVHSEPSGEHQQR